MSFRTKVSAIAVTAAACMLFAPAAMASSGPIQVTGRQLKSALLPASDFLASYSAGAELDSGRKLEHGTVFKLPSMSCKNFWLFIGVVGGFGETSYSKRPDRHQVDLGDRIRGLQPDRLPVRGYSRGRLVLQPAERQVPGVPDGDLIRREGRHYTANGALPVKAARRRPPGRAAR